MSALTILRPPRPQLLAPARGPNTAATVAVAVGAVAAAVPWRLSESWWLEVGLVAVLLLAGMAVVVDITDHRIPDRLVLASLVPTVAVLAVRVGSDGAGAAMPDVLFGAVALALPLLVAHLTSPAALGFGDVKLGGALGAALGLVDWRCSVVALCIASGLTAAVALVRRRSTVAFAPGLVAGTALVLVLAIFEGSPTWR